MAIRTSLILKLIDQMSAPLRRATNNFQSFSTGVKRFQKAQQVAANVNLAAEASLRTGRALTGVLAGPVKEVEGFDVAMSRAKAISGAAGKDYDALRAKAKNLGATTRYTATQVAEGMGNLAMMGFKTPDILESMPTLLSLSTASAMDLGDASLVAARTLRAFKLPISDMGRVSDVLTQTFTNTGTSLEGLRETMKYSAPVAQKYGVSLEQTAAMAGLLGNVGIEGSQAGTTLSAMITRLGAPRRLGVKALEAIGVSAYDSAGKMRPLLEVLVDVQRNTALLSDERRNKVIQHAFGQEALAGVLELLSQVSGTQMRELSEALTNAKGRTEEIAQVMMDNGAGATILLTSAVSGLYTSIGEQLNPTLTALKNALTGIIQSMTEWTDRHPRLTRYIFYAVAAAAAFTTVIGALLMAVGSAVGAAGLMSLVFGLKMTGIQIMVSVVKLKWLSFALFSVKYYVITAVIPAFKALWAVMLSHPILLIIAAVIALIYVWYLLYKHWDTITQRVKSLWQQFTEASTGAKVAIVSALLAIVAGTVPVIGVFMALGAGAYLVVKYWGPLKQWFKELWWSVKDSFWSAVSWIVDKIKAVIAIIQGEITKAQQILSGAPGGPREMIAPGARRAATANLAGARALATRAVGAGQQLVGGTIKVHVDSEGRASVTKVESTGGIGFDIGTGPMMVAP